MAGSRNRGQDVAIGKRILDDTMVCMYLHRLLFLGFLKCGSLLKQVYLYTRVPKVLAEA